MKSKVLCLIGLVSVSILTAGCQAMMGWIPPLEYSESVAKAHVHEYKIDPSMCYNVADGKFETAQEFFKRIAGTSPELRNEGVIYQSISRDGRVRECAASITNGKSTYCECWGTPGEMPR